jgi:phosphatidylserine/phosphatidylglycerophosphate/cardiolipin synthase-like enzyme
VGREFTDEGLQFLWELAPHAVASGALQAYTLASSLQKQDQTFYRSIYVHAKTTIVDDVWVTVGSANLNNRGMRDDTEMNVALMYPEMVHILRILLMAEHLGLCDEDNLFRILQAMGQVKTPEGREKMAPFMLSLKRWLHPPRYRNSRKLANTRSTPMDNQVIDDLGALWKDLQSQLADPLNGLALFAKQARENLLAIKAGQPLVGHLLPYIRYNQAQEYEIEAHAVNGWLDILPNFQAEKADIASSAEMP